MKRALGIGLASAALLTGCSTETVGNSIVAPNGECLAGKSSLELGPSQAVYIGGDMKIDGDNGVQDSLKLTNVGKGVLDISRSHGDEGTLAFSDNSAEVPADPNEDHGTDFSLDLNDGDASGGSFEYREDKTSIAIQAATDGPNINIQLATTCAK